MNNILSIFNDVIGPVMRGPSSSHTAASWRIARVCLDILNEPIKKAVIDFDKDGAWASNYLEQGTVMGINGGLLGLNITDEMMKHTEVVAKEIGVVINYEINSFPTKHTNTVRLKLESKGGKKVQFVAASIGGGAFEIQQIDNFHVNIQGDYFETLIWKKKNDPIPENINTIISENVLMFQSFDENRTLINLKSPKKFPFEKIDLLKKNHVFDECIVLHPILPIVSGNGIELPFDTIGSLLEYAEKKNKLDMGDMGLIYEECQSGLSRQVLINKMESIIKIIEDSIKTGLKGTKHKDRILHQQSHLIENADRDGKIQLLINWSRLILHRELLAYTLHKDLVFRQKNMAVRLNVAPHRE